MKASPEKLAEALRVSLKEAERLRQRNQQLRQAVEEPIAIVGMSCRYPGGASSPEELWGLVAAGTDAISAFPTDRGWDLDRLYDPDPDRPNTSYAGEGGFVYDAAEFDPGFFAVSPHQARTMDPQLRLLLEASWTALEDAGIDPQRLRGSQTGVFAGVMHHDYGWRIGRPRAVGLPLGRGSGSVVSGHVAYTLGLEGPTMTVDTACSSSLVALHLAVQALRGGECALALSGGVTVLATPAIFTQFSRQRGLARDGRCKSFSEAADGAGFSEGVGTLVLERLSDAQANGRRIVALIRGTAVNQDGASNGFTAPNGPSQERVIRQALANAGLATQDVDAVEAHGTGTALGDPIEAGALLATYGRDRARPLMLGSIKSNLGHTQAAAGVAGVIKMALAMREGVLPKTLHVDAPSPKVDWEAGSIELLGESMRWDAEDGPRRAGVSSFGASGTNAHVILEEAPGAEAVEDSTRPLPGPIPLVLSAKAEPALAEAAERLASHLTENPDLDPTNLAYSLATTRSAFEHRAVALGSDREELLAALAGGEADPNLLTAKATDGKLALLFTGQGSQRLGMGRELHESDPVFRDAFERVCEQLDPHLETPLQEIVFAEGKKAQALLDDTTYAQPALFAIEVALFEALSKRGLTADLLTGHSIGEIAAAHVAGVLELPDAAKLVAARGRLMGVLPKGGAMAAIEATEGEVAGSIEGRQAELAIAAVNGPNATVISGAAEAVEEVRARWDAEGRRTKALAVSHAFHSPLMEPMLEEFAEVAGSLTFSEPRIPIVSNVSGELLTAEHVTDPAYWVRHAREPVRFADVVATLAEQGAAIYMELGPDPVLCAMARECLGDEEGQATFVPTLREGREEAGTVSTAIAYAHAAGANLDWEAFFAGTGARPVPLPTYAFQRERYWLSSYSGAANLGAAGFSDADHPMLAAALEDPGDAGLTLTGRLSLDTHPWLGDHRVAGAALLPGTAFLQLALRAAEPVGAETVQELALQAPLVLPDVGAVTVQVSVSGPGEDGRRDVSIYSQPETGTDEDLGGTPRWTHHAQGVLSTGAVPAPESVGAWPPEGAEPLEVDYLYDRLAEHGLVYGPAFQGLTAAWKDGERIYAEVSLPEEPAQQAEHFGIHPALLDAALHAIALAASEESAELRLPFFWGGVSLWAKGARELRVTIAPRGESVAMQVADGAGAPVATIGTLVSRPLDRAGLQSAGSREDGLLELRWSTLPLAEQGTAPAEVELLRCGVDADVPTAEAARRAAQSALESIQRWLGDESKADSRLALITAGAAAVGEESPDPAAAAIWGLVRSAQLEHPGRFVLIDTDGSDASEAVLSAALAIGVEEPQLALREGVALVPRLARAKAAEDVDDTQAIDPERTVLITGGTGGLGALTARHLVESHGARHLLLASRSGSKAQGAKELKGELQELGAEVQIAACDVSDHEAVKKLLAKVPKEHPLGAVIHCAGTLADATVESLTAEQVDQVFAPKVSAAWNLHQLTKDLDIHAFVLFSSAAGVFGALGQANYAGANAFLDALAQERQAAGLPATSIGWGLWERGGMVTGLAEMDVARMRRGGIEALSDRRGLALFDAAIDAGRPQALAVLLDAAGLRTQASTGALPPVLRGLVRTRGQRRATSGSLAVALAALPEGEREGHVLDLVRGEIATILGHTSAAEVEPDKAFQDLGFDSLAAVELRNRLNTATGLHLDATTVFDYPNAAVLAERLLAEASASPGGGRVALRAQASEEPVAIVGMACRYPGGVSSPEELWQLVAEGGDGITEFPADRGWDTERLYHPDPEHPGTSYTREGGFLLDAADFDAEFFGISPREALAMDPQQRLLLESCWEALEDAGIDPVSLRRTQTGVFAGVMYQDYGPAAGMTQSVVSGRIAYSLGLEGPAITVDTACSSSLVAMHLAAQALRQGECSLALAGGVTALANPAVFVEFSRQRGLAPDGRSKSFAEAADGVAWAEGVGVLVLERLSEAKRNGHPVLATIRGSAVNQDGASNGLTAPNGPSQERVIRQALANARLAPKDIDAVEAHGTGTTLGDPIEAGALLATYGQDREEPLRLGSIKSNIGHTQAAAGVAGVIKMTEAMRRGVLPKTLHVDAPSSKVEWEAGEIELLTEQVPWEGNGRPRRAGISSFGISGTNAHVILEEAPGAEAVEETKQPLPGPVPLALSAKAEPALAEAAERLAAHIEESPELDPVDVAYSLATTRTAFEHRAVVIGSDRGELLAALEALADRPSGAPSQAAFAGVPARGLPTVGRARDGKLAYLFTGQGSQRLGMGQELYEADPVFREAFEAVCEQLDAHLERSLKEIVFAAGKKAQAVLDDTTYAQPALFAIEVALFEALSKRGLVPDLLTGHSIGEIAAAHVAGVFDLPDAAKLVAARGRLMGALPKGGAMAAIEASEEEIAESIDGREEELSIAAVNGPTATVISGTAEAVEAVRAHWEEQGRRTKQLAVSHAFHSPLMEPMLEEFAEVAGSLAFSEPNLPVVSNLTGEPLSPEQATDPAYWVRHVREPVRFADAVATLQKQGASTYLELGPDPVLCAMARECLDEAEQEKAAFLPTLREGREESEAIATSIAHAHTAGVKVSWEAFFKDTGAKRVPLPTYPFQRKRYWLSSDASAGDAGSIGQVAADHPLLGATVELAGTEEGSLLLTGRLSLSTHPWLADHAVGEVVLLPGTAFLELALRAAEQVGAESVEELTLQAPLVLPEPGAVAIQVTVSGLGEDGRREIAIHSRLESAREEEPVEAQEWTRNAEGTLSSEPAQAPRPFEAWPPEGAEPLETDYLYDLLAEHGLRYGPAFQGLGAAWKQGEEIYAEVALSEEQAQGAERFAIHPALLDSALHAIALAASEGSGELRLPFSWGGVSLVAQGARELRVHIAPGAEGQVSLNVADSTGAHVATVGALAMRALDPTQLKAPARKQQGLLGIEWTEVSLNEKGTEPTDVELLRCEVDADLPTDQAAGKAAESALASIQAFLADDSKADSRLALITKGAMATGKESPDPASAAIWGLLRSAQSEHPGRFALIDTDGSEASEEALQAALALGAQEPQLALREGVALAPRAMPQADTEDSLIPPLAPWHLDATKRGTLESLALMPSTHEPLGPTEVRIRMQAAGLNFRDVLVALGLYPGEAPIGSEGAGVVLEVGAEVTDLSTGDRVMGLIPDAFGPLATAERDFLAKVPEAWSAEQAAAMPIVFATAFYGLNDLAKLKAGEKVLIHAGAGGVGMAAIGIAQHLGAEVFATASPSKWEVLEGMGLDPDHLASSRDLDFKEKFLALTDGEGMDVLLNALTGEFIDASLALLPRGGRFLEMGKTDLRDPGQLKAERPGFTYLPFDLTEVSPKRSGEILTEVAGLLEAGALHHSPTTTWDLREAPQAFRHLREGRNVGKVVLTLPQPIDPKRTTLITGATGGLGALIARHLTESHGARHLLLVSRSGEEAEGAKELKRELEELGAEVEIAACDVSDRGALQKLLGQIPKEHPLGAVIHCAGTLADATVNTLTAEQVEQVFAPKVDAAWNLHELSKDAELSAFVLFSSAAGTLGGPGQANYAAANVFLDALAQRRAAEGLPATAIAWGLWQREGMGSGLAEADLARMRRGGIEPISDERGLELFDAAIAQTRPQALALPLDPAGLRAGASTGALPPILSALVRTSKRRGPTGSLATKLSSLPEVEHEAHVLDLVRAEVAAVLGHSSSQEIEPDRAFNEIGFDSLAAVELRNRLNSATGLRLGATTVFDYPTPQKLAGRLLSEATASGSSKQLATRARASEEPIAILGMACRYPGGVSSPEDLWRLVAEGGDGISEFPTDRGWDLTRLYHPDPEHPGTSYAREGGFLKDATSFDAEFFGIAPREALGMDPQQRLLLESCWEALEDAGIDPTSLRGEPAGVFAGLIHQGYSVSSGMAVKEIEGYQVTGSTGSVASGRIAYSLGLEGPAITVDTACSSSLVAMHLASQALRQGECSLALAGGVTALANPAVFVEFSRQRGLAPDGRSKSFAEAADGVAWAEGVGVLVLERLSEAKRNGHPVLATIRGSAVNQDGASNGLTAPNGPSQERVIRQALANARLAPKDIDAVEAHGTGTTLGDPIEAGALLATYGQDREEPLRLGSIKSNIGHTQAAAGVAGVIKMTEAMRRGVLPKTLHVDEPSSHVDWEAGEIELLTEQVPWEGNGRPRRAGISSFGISGTNAHVILEEAPGAEAVEETKQPLPGPVPLALSAKAEPALAEAAERLAAHIEESPELDPVDVAYSLATTRTAFEHRAVALGADREELLAALGALAVRQARDGKLAFLFTGQGSQRLGMGKELYGSDPLFKAAFDEVCEQLDLHLERPLKEIVFAAGKKAQAVLDDTTYAQPALFAIEVALFEALSKRGLVPDLLTGHSIGEIAAAHVAGVFDLPDAAKLVAARGRLMGALPKGGAMAAIEASEEEIAESIDGREEELSIAAVNGPTATVISGTAEAVEAVRAHWEEQGRRTKQLAVSHAFHSPLMEPMLEEFAEVAGSLAFSEPNLPVVSNLTGEPLSPEQATDPAYWVRHVREPVRFADAVATLQKQGASTYLELGPDPVLCAMARECLDEAEQEKAAFLPTLREGREESEAIATSIAHAHTAGVKVSWEAFFKDTGAKRVPLPTYPFQRKRYWLSSDASAGDAGSIGQVAADHPLLGATVELAGTEEGSLLLTGRLSLSTHPWLADHAVGEVVLLPGTAFLELALRAAEQVGAESVEELTLQAPLVLPEPGAVAIQVTVSGLGEDGRREIAIHSRLESAREEEPVEAQEWTRNAEGTLSSEPAQAPRPFEAWPPEGAEPLETDYLYDLLAEHGLRYGPAFQGLGAAWKQGEEIYAEVALSEEQAQGAERFAIHPALLDSALHAIALAASEGSGELRLPFSWGGVSLVAQGARELRVHIAPGAEGQVSLNVADSTGAHVATVGALAMRALDPTQLKAPARKQQGLLGIEWTEVSLNEKGTEPTDVELLRCEVDADLPTDQAAGKAAESALASIQAFLADDSKADSRLALITKGAMATGKESPDPASAAIWGLLRSAQSEHPGRFALIDTDGSEASEEALQAALALGAQEPQLALREGVALAPRAMPQADTEDSLIPPLAPWHLDATKRGTLESLALMPSTHEPLGPTEVRIRMQAAGLNFRDVLVALGLYPGEAPIGSEGAGVVLEVGAEVTDLSTGDRVMGLIPDAFGPLATAERDFLAKVPEAWSAEQAAAMPIVFATAFYGLNDLAKLKAGEKVLIHAGAGGVGMAAIGIAQHLGAEVFATASPSKWEVLEGMGLDPDHLASSRDLDFKEKFLALTDGEGMDVLLNALTGEFIDASLALLPRGGRFLEMGKTDLRDPGQLKAERPGFTYLPFDLTEVSPKRSGEILTEVAGLLEAGALHHSPTTTWDLREAPQAFRHLREGRNVGKVVLTLPQPIDPERTTLITGATGGLGALIARHLTESHGARHLLLVSRSGEEAEGAKELKRELEELGAEVEIAACDVSDRGALQKLLGQIPKEHPLGAVIHCAGTLADATVNTLTAEQVEQVFAPKVDAAWNLHELSKDAELSAFVLFSSAAGTLGGPGQANYAAANVFLDALAQRRAAEGLPATAIAWGLWQREGMGSGLAEADLARMRRGGIEPISDERGLELFDAAIAQTRPQALALPLDPAGLRAGASTGALPPILSALVRTSKRRGPTGSLATKLSSLPEVEHEAHVLDLVRAEVAAVLGHSSSQEIEPDRAFNEIGFDSLAAVELRNRLNSATGLRLGATTVFDYPTPQKLAGRLLSEATASGSSKQLATRARASEEPIAILGMACRYPGGVSSPEDLWRLVAEGGDGISEFPTDRGWDLNRLYHPDPEHPGTSYAREGGFLKDATSFDAEFFGIAPREALGMDPQQRLLLESCWEALEDAGIDPTSLRGEPAGVFAGLIHQGYSVSSGMAVKEIEGYQVTGSTGSVASGRIAYSLGLEGPAITVDTACSSSLVAMHLASQALRQGECSLALAGGVTALANPAVFVEFSRQRGLAPDGRSKSFAEAADGVAWAEGVGVLVLERLSEAKRNGHPVLATIRGSAVNQDGASNGLTAPNGPSQERVIRQALANAGLAPKDIDAVEAHGTGTTLGDPIEAGALLATYGQDREEPLRARLDQVEHRPHPGRSRSRRRDQDDRGDAQGRLAQDPARRCALLPGRLGGGGD